jgi:hypothetical protein
MARHSFKLVAVGAIALMTIALAAPAADAQRPRPSRVPPPPPAGSGPGVSLGVGSGGVRVGAAPTGTGHIVLDSLARGVAIGGAGGPIGLAIGAGVGLIHGLWAKHRHEANARAEAERQREMDRELEEQMRAQRPGGALAGGTGDEQGVLIVKNHLDEPASASPASDSVGTRVASVPPDRTSDAPPRDRVDAEGFRSVYEGDRLVRRERRAAGGRVDVVLHYDEQGRMVRRDEATRPGSGLDTSTFYADGKPVRKESDTDGDGRADVWATYDATGELSRMESLVEGGRRHTQVYAGGAVTREEWRSADGQLTAVAHYEAGRVVRRELYEIDESAFTRVPLVSTDAEPAR